MKPVYYICLGSTEALSRPFDRLTSLESAKQMVATERANGRTAFHITATEYKELTGRTASADYWRELES